MTTTTTTRLSKWAADIRAIKENKLTPKDKRQAFQHLENIIAFNNVLFYTGFFFSFLDVSYVFPWVMMGLSISSHWTTVSHHISHGGYIDKNADADKKHHNKYNRFTYGVKMRRRFLDWMDYILPEAWACEHNIHHHYKLNEATDPDNVQQNLVILRTMNDPCVVK